jgi:hypothetical protein
MTLAQRDAEHQRALDWLAAQYREIGLVESTRKRGDAPMGCHHGARRLEEVELHVPSRKFGANYSRPRVGPSSPIDPGLRLGEQEGWGLFLEDYFLLF